MKFKKKLLLLLFYISPPITYLEKSWFLSYRSKCCCPIKLQDFLKCNISRKKWIMKFVFSMQINIEIFYKLILSFWVCIARHAQSTQNKKFAYLCYISRKTWGMKVDFLPADKRQRFLQICTIILGVFDQLHPNYLT